MVNPAMMKFHSLLQEPASGDKAVSIEKSRATPVRTRGVQSIPAPLEKQTLGSAGLKDKVRAQA